MILVSQMKKIKELGQVHTGRTGIQTHRGPTPQPWSQLLRQPVSVLPQNKRQPRFTSACFIRCEILSGKSLKTNLTVTVRGIKIDRALHLIGIILGP